MSGRSFILVAARPALDLCNTQLGDDDLLATPDDLSRWFVLPTAGLLWLTFATGAPMLQRLVARHRSSRASLAIDYRFLARLRLDKAANRRNLMSGLVGAGLGAFIAVLGVWATLKAG